MFDENVKKFKFTCHIIVYMSKISKIQLNIQNHYIYNIHEIYKSNINFSEIFVTFY